MAENKDTIVTLKIRHDDREWVKDEQTRLRKSEGREPSHAEVFQRMRAAYMAAQSGKESQTVTTKPETAPYTRQEEEHRLLQFIFDHGSEEEANWIIGNLQMFERAIESSTRASRKRRRAG